MLTPKTIPVLTAPAAASSFIPFDTSFGTGGTVAAYAPSFLYRLDLSRLGDGGLLLAGHRRPAPQAPLQLAVARYHADGRPDVAFGAGGITVVGGPPTVTTLPTVRTTVQPDGKILVATVLQLASQEQRWSLTR